MKNQEIGNDRHHFGKFFAYFLIGKGSIFGTKSDLGKCLLMDPIITNVNLEHVVIQ